jgi:3-hydroxyisobutyrate dehydrogenase
VKTIGWIGVGVMGKSMCGHLLKNGYSLNIYTRTKAKAEELLTAGAKWMEPAELAANSDVVITMLGFPHDVEEVILGPNGLLKNMKKGSYLIDHTTSKPQLAVKIYE